MANHHPITVKAEGVTDTFSSSLIPNIATTAPMPHLAHLPTASPLTASPNSSPHRLAAKHHSRPNMPEPDDHVSATRAGAAAAADHLDLDTAAAAAAAARTIDLENGPLKFHLNPAASTKEPFRDWRGPVTIHRLITVVWVVGVMAAFYFIQIAIWTPNGTSRYADTWIASPYIGFILVISFPSSLLTLIGALWFRFNPDLDKVSPIPYNVVFRIVSRGLNKDCLIETIRICQDEMRKNSFFPYLIEVVTDADAFQAPDDPDVIQLKVPPSYATPKGTLFKARALHYACEKSVVPGNAWLVHLDEETRPTSSSIKGIAKMIGECEKKGDITRIGQGCILYYRAFKKHPFLTLADTRRTGDDFGHFFLQHRIGRTMFGLHGAFIVCRQDMEAKVGFDIGPKGSVTEDAWWILLAMKEGYRTCWVDGFLDEQSTQSIMDFLKQRRRWTYGLIKVASLNPVPVHYRLSIAWFVLTWVAVPFLLPLQLGYTIALIVFNLPIPLYFRLPTVFIVTMQIYVYFVGWLVNVREYGEMEWWKIPFWTIVQLLLVPVFLVLEIVAVLISFCAGCTQNGKGFHIVQKDATKKVDYSTGSDAEDVEDEEDGSSSSG